MQEICDYILDKIRIQSELLHFVCAQRYNILEIWDNRYGHGIYEVKTEIENAQVIFYNFNDRIASRKPIIKFNLNDPNTFEQIEEYLKNAYTEK